MFELITRIKREKLVGLLFVLLLHAAGLYGLWSYSIIPTPDEAVTLMVNLINPPPAQPKPPQPKPEPPKPKPEPKPKPIEPPPPEHHHLVVEAPVVQPDEPVAYAPPPPPPAPPAPPVVEAPPLPPQPVMLSNDLSVICPERSPPDYPRLARRMNEQGKVMLRIELGTEGQIAHAEVKTSSGYKRLDEAALNAVKAWRCQPYVRNGVAVPVIAMQPFNFKIEER